MATIKDLLRAFGKASSRLAYPSNSAINLNLTVGQTFTYTAPSDGTFFLEVSGYGEAGWINVYNTVTAGENWRSQSSPKAFIGLSTVNFQCRKGDTLTVDTGNDTFESVACRFFHDLANAAGGGLKALCNQYVRRDCVCLTSNPSCASSGVSLRRSASTRDQKIAFRSRSLRNRQNTFHHKTDGSHWRQTERECKQSLFPITYKFSLSTVSGLGVGARYQSSEVLKSQSMSGGFPQQPRIKPSLFRHAASSNASRWEVAA